MPLNEPPTWRASRSAKVEKVQIQLREQGHEPADAKTLLAKAHQYLTESKAAWEANDFAKAYHDAQRRYGRSAS